MRRTAASRVIVEGAATGEALVSAMPISFWGGVDVATGKVIDVHHDLCGQCVSGKVLCIPSDRGSCSGSGVMLEMIRQNTAPSAILCLEAEPVLSLGSVLGLRLYGRGVAIHTVDKAIFDSLRSGENICVRDSGGVEIG